MTDKNYTAIAVIVDRSGSMVNTASDAEGGLRSYIQDQAKRPGKCTVRLTEFDTDIDYVYPSTDINDVPDYHLVPRGWTALRDAMGKTIVSFGEELAALPEDERPGTVIVLTITDGQENSSREWSVDALKGLIEKQQNEFNWNFVFLAADQDAILTASTFGIGANTSMSYSNTSAGTRNTYAAMSNVTTNIRLKGSGSFSDSDRDAAVSP